jgi:zinc transport system permease protein
MNINLLEIFQYGFMVRAILAGLIIGLIAPLIGTFLVAKKYALIADTLAHVSLVGVAIGLLVGIYPIYSALLVTMIVAVIIEKLRTDQHLSGETALAIFLSGGLATAIVLLSLSKGFNVDIFSYLFGSIATVTSIDLWLMLILGIIVVSTVIIFYQQLFYIAFDEETAAASGIDVKKLNLLLLLLTATVVGMAIRVVGALLIGALMVIPVVTASKLANSFRKTLLISIFISLISVIFGLIAAFYINLPAGGTIVIVSLLFFCLTLIFKSH